MWTLSGFLRPIVLLLTVFAIGALWFVIDPRADALGLINRDLVAWRAYADEHLFVAITVFVAVYAAAVVAMLPIALVMTLASGAIFGAADGAMGSVLGAVLGAVIAYGAARATTSTTLRLVPSSADRLQRWKEGFRARPFAYTLSLRLMPLTPFTLVSVAGGLSRIDPAPFILGTALGVLPECVIYASLGAGMSSGLRAGHLVDPANLLHPVVLLALVGLALLPLLSLALPRHGSRTVGGRTNDAA